MESDRQSGIVRRVGYGGCAGHGPQVPPEGPGPGHPIGGKPHVQSGSLGVMDAPNVGIRQVAMAKLTESEVSVIRDLLRAAFANDGEGFTDDDWEHAAGGTHFLLEEAGVVLAYASVVARELQVDGRPLRVGYVEAVATRRTSRAEGTARPSCGRSTSTSGARTSSAR